MQGVADKGVEERLSVDEDGLRKRGVPPEAFQELARAYARRAEGRFGAPLGDAELGAMLTELAAFIARRSADETLVRVSALGAADGEGDGAAAGASRLTVLETCTGDRSYIIDTLRMIFEDLDLAEVHAATLILPVRRDARGKLLSIRGDADGHHNESICRFVLRGAAGETERERLASEVRGRMEAVRQCAAAALRLRKLVREAMNEYQYLAEGHANEREALLEARALLEWLLKDNYRLYAAVAYRPGSNGHALVPETRLGPDLGWNGAVPPADVSAFLGAEGLTANVIEARKSDRVSSFHKRGKLDELLVRRFDDTGKAAGGLVLFGQFSTQGLETPTGQVPIARRKLDQVLRAEEVVPSSFRENAIVKAFNTLPLEFVLHCDTASVHDVVSAILDATSQRETVAHVKIERLRCAASVFVTVAEEQFSHEVQERIQALLRAELVADSCEHRVSTGVGNSIVLFLYLAGGRGFAPVGEDEIASRVEEMCTPWGERLRAVATSRWGERVVPLCERYAGAFPSHYQLATSPEAAWRDVEHLEACYTEGRLQFDVVAGDADLAQDQVRLLIFHTEPLHLSDILPILDRFGLRVLDQDTIRVEPEDRRAAFIDTFRLQAPPGAPERRMPEDRGRFVDALRTVFEGKVDSDPLNRLVISAGLGWQEVDVLRAYLGYAVQLKALESRALAGRVLAAHPEAASALAELFAARFDPDLQPPPREGEVGLTPPEEPTQQQLTALARMDRMLASVRSAADDRVLRLLQSLVLSTVRTNLYRTDRSHHYLSFKIECVRVETMPEPRPLYEIYVHEVGMEGVHLRGSRIARGGIRWSDRLDDYRTEIFGLQRAQMVKNVLIIPEGSKGGFVLRKIPSGTGVRKLADEKYQVFIRGLLDVTDNLDAGRPVGPPRVVRRDRQHDPYLVVAADKGTAHLSDTANAISRAYGFWLDDAFASGGSVGYDHKALGITARGAWACARQGLLGLGLDPDKDVISVVGIGDMSGDVFGNGLLLSRNFKLVGAFNHKHVFVDPEPDTERSFRERERLFHAKGSQWSDYDPAALSAGGGVYERSAKEVALSPEARARLGFGAERVSPDEVIRRLLCLEVDLLWNGGIGTYIKSSEEDHRDVADKANDSVRVDAGEVRARVIAEGGNLGATQRGRVEYALRGGRINTDFVDNAAGVHCSDREVNVKILFNREVSLGHMTREDRDRAVLELAPEVCAACIRANEASSLMITLDEIRSQRDPYVFLRTIRYLQQAGILRPEHEGLPSLRSLQARGLKYGLTRPELAKVCAFMKMHVTRELVAGNPTRLPGNDAMLAGYWPPRIYDSFRDGISNHPLLAEILATRRVNEELAFAGATAYAELAMATGRGLTDVALAYALAFHWLGIEKLRRAILELPASVPARAVHQALIGLEDGLREAASWLLYFHRGDDLWARVGADKTGGQRRRQRTVAALDEYQAAYEALVASLPVSAERAYGRTQREAKLYEELGLPGALAQRLALSSQWEKVMAVRELVRAAGCSVTSAAASYLGLGQQTGLNLLILRVGRQPANDDWEVQALSYLRTTLLRCLYRLTEKALRDGLTPAELLQRRPALAAIGREVSRAQPSAEAPVPVPVLVVISEKLRTEVRTL
jgi:glutamate dehydrogenase